MYMFSPNFRLRSATIGSSSGRGSCVLENERVFQYTLGRFVVSLAQNKGDLPINCAKRYSSSVSSVVGDANTSRISISTHAACERAMMLCPLTLDQLTNGSRIHLRSAMKTATN